MHLDLPFPARGRCYNGVPKRQLDCEHMDGIARVNTLKSLLQERILVVDGAMGTAIQGYNLGPDDFGGSEYEGCNEYLALTAPQIISDIHIGFFEAGSDIIETDTFGGTSIVLAEFGLQDKALEINQVAAEIARQVANQYSTPNKPRFVAGSMGPTTKTISVTGGATFAQMRASYAEQAEGLLRHRAEQEQSIPLDAVERSAGRATYLYLHFGQQRKLIRLPEARS